MKPGEERYPNIFSPGRIGKVEFKNRIKYASTETNFNYGDGFVAEREVAYMEAQARGGAGLVTTQGAYTDPGAEGQGYVGMMGIWDDKYIPGLKRIADVIREHDSVSVLQLMHCGRVGGVELDYTVGPSVVPQRIPRFREPVEMSDEKIELTIEEHVQGALRCQEAGYDMVEISGIVGYLVSNFISKYTNIRTDKWGGDIVGRARFMTEIVRRIRKAVGPDFPIIIRLCGDELLHDRGGNTTEESLQAIKLAQEAGIDCLSVTAGWQESAVSVISRDCAQGSWLYIAEKMKKELDVSVAMAYRLFEPQYPEAAIAAGNLDVWESCRAMIADPELPNKILEGREDEIRPCMACNICLARLFRDAELDCMVRPSLGHERDPSYGFYGFPGAEHKRKVAIVGAGLAGMQAGAIAAEKGHDVTIYDKLAHTGGQSEAAAHGPWGDEEFMRLVNYLEGQCTKHGVSFELDHEVTRDELKALEVDEVIVATGAEPAVPDVPGIDRPNVVSALDVMRGQVDVGEKVVILSGKGVAISTALYLLDKGGHEVALVSAPKKLGLDVNPSYIWRYRQKLKKGGAVLATLCNVVEINDEGVVVQNKATKEQMTLPADTVVLAEMKAVDELVGAKKGHYTIGDALLVRRGNSAILDGYRMGMRL
jgi:2,4-dienoyl-CoA reductase (NADPH2)